MKKTIMMAAATMLCAQLAAQETYENAKLANLDLNGTARYVGMGGAMEALGADISTINTNPAGIGLFRRSTANVSFGMVSQQDAESYGDANKTNMSFDQAGFVYSMRTGSNSYLNLSANYTKSKNFDYILSATGALNNASQGKLTYLKGYTGVFSSSNDITYNQMDHLYLSTTMAPDAQGTVYYDNATQYAMTRGNTGYIGQYAFNISGNSNDRIYWGVTFGLHDVHYKGESRYSEVLESGDQVAIGDRRKITGSGFDIKAGIIVRPTDSPFRFGVYVHTPTWYDLTTSNQTALLANYASASSQLTDKSNSASIGESYDFVFHTPWKFGASVGTTVGNYLALGATYEYADYGACDIRVKDGDYYDYWDGYYSQSSRDEVMKDKTEQTLKGVSTLKLGVEFKPVDNVSVRLGYNYVSPMYQKDGFKDGSLESYGSYYSSATDYTNWKSTNRVTAGVGYSAKNWSVDLAYQYSQTNGEFAPFMSYYPTSSADQDLTNDPGYANVSNKRHQLLLTLGYKF